MRLHFSDASRRPPWDAGLPHRIVRTLERATVPFLETLLATRAIARADAVLAIFESQGNALALLRALRVPPYRRSRLAIVSCWLAQEAPGFGAFRRRWYRFAYRHVDRVIYFSRNQAAVYEHELGLRPPQLAFVPFGVDHRYFTPSDRDDGYVLAVGRDRGRDWRTLFDAVRDTDLDVQVVARPADVAGLDVPANVHLRAPVDRATYRALTGAARAVVVPTEVRAYPTGQSVVLESMAMAKCCVVTDTPAMRDYLRDGDNAVLVPPHDAAALRAALTRVTGDADLRATIGTRARAAIDERFNAPAMWAEVASIIGEMTGHRRGGR